MPDDKKLIIDEDWKSQVQAEKEAAAKKAQASESASEPASPGLSSSKSAGGDKANAPSSDHNEHDPPMPPASFEMLVSTLATETLAALGQFPHPATGKAEVYANQAQYLIDTLDVLRQKCQGNLTAAEQQLIESVLHQLRMVFIAVANQPAST
jgi:Domain of unknown function (DUF1844)